MTGAYEDGLRLLSRRSLTRQEVSERLRRRGHNGEDIDQAIDRLAEIKAIDDAAVARSWITATAAARGRGRERAIAELVSRGVDREVASAAWSEAADDDAVEETTLLARAVRRRLGLPAAPVKKARLARVYNALLFEGFGANETEAALVPYGFEGDDP